jgi:transcriptional regulator with GAF, ATPase, and Fis domain
MTYFIGSAFSLSKSHPFGNAANDVPLLAAHFLNICAKKINTQPPKLTKGNIERLQAYDWPGNIRELQNVIERAVIFAQTGALSFDFLRLERSKSRGSVELFPPTLRPAPIILTESELKRRERESIVAALAEANGKISGPRGAAELLGMKPTTLTSRIKALGLKSNPSESSSRRASDAS